MRSLIIIILGAVTILFVPRILLMAFLAFGEPELVRGYPALAVIIMGLIIVAGGLYVLRNTHRIWYGALEMGVGVLLMISAVSTYVELLLNDTLHFNFSDHAVEHQPHVQGYLGLQSTSLAILQVAAAIYVLIRGLDNFGEGLRSSSHSKWTLLWARVFQTSSKQ